MQSTAKKLQAKTTSPPQKKREHRYMPIKLKAALAEYGLSQTDWRKAVIQDAGLGKGKPISSSAGSQLLNWDTWPKMTKAQTIIDATVKLLHDADAPKGVIATIWQEDKSDTTRSQQPKGVHKGQYFGKNKNKQSPFDTNLPEAEMLSQTAKNHFQIFTDPFVNDVQKKEDVFLSTEQRYIAEAMYSAAKLGGFLAVVGESGAGKSVLRRALLDRINTEGLEVTMIMPRVIDKKKLTAGLICESIIKDITGREDAPMRQTLEGKARQIEKLLTGSSRAGTHHVLLIEEAHDITIATLKYLKRFWEIEDGYKKLLSIILVGQPELKYLLDEKIHWEAREVIARIEVAELLPLNGSLEEYLALKFNRINIKLDKIFAKDAYEALRERLTIKRRGQSNTQSMCYPLRVNNTVTKAMNLAAQMGEPKVTGEIIKEV